MYLLLLTIFLISLYFLCKNKTEKFEGTVPKIANNSIRFKKSNSYNLIYECKKYCVWECNPINEYFPIGQVVTKTKHPPESCVILIHSHDIKKRISDYELISSTNDGMKIWKPNVTGVCSFIFSINKPSLNRIKAIPMNCLKKTQINEMVFSDKNFNIWNIHDSNYIYIQDTINKNRKLNIEFYRPNMTCFRPEKPLLCVKTNSFKKLYGDTKLSIWRPIAPKNYKPLGDCIFKPNENPNGKKNIIVAHKSVCYPIIDYHDVPVCQINKLSIWKPNCPIGYNTLGHVISFDGKEPYANEVYSIPLEYLDRNNDIKNMKNSIDESETGTYSLWNNDHFCFGTSDLKKPTNSFKINMNYCLFEKNSTEIPQEVSMELVVPIDDDLDDEMVKEIKNTLSQRTGVSHYRFNEFKQIDNKIYFTIDSKPINTKEDSIDEIMETLLEITNKKPLYVNDDIAFKNIVSNHTINKDTIALDNSTFNNKLVDSTFNNKLVDSTFNNKLYEIK